MKISFGKLLLAIVGAIIVIVIIAIATISYFSYSLPDVTSLSKYRPPVRSEILSKDGVVLAEIGVENRDIVPIEEIPPAIINAFLAAEDDNFYNHTGVDYLGIVRAFIANMKAGKVVQGGSTITQQVAKTMLLSSERSIVRKIKDALLAQKIEKHFSKKDILFLYLNQVYLGGGYYGVKSAFDGYFGKELSEVTVAEGAMVAGLLVAPGRYSPYLHPSFAKSRQKYVLRRLLDTGKITDEEYDKAVDEKIKYRIKKPSLFKAGYFTDWVRQRVIKLVGEENFLKNGFKVTTTLDWELQEVAEKAILQGVREIDKRQGFKGPLGNLDLDSQREIEEIAFRKQIAEDESEYFILDEDANKIYEKSYDEESFKNTINHQSDFADGLKEQRFVAGNLKEDTLFKSLKIGENYNAIVLKVDDQAKAIYVSIGGLVGVIPQSGFIWAHERTINENTANYNQINNPSTIVKAGDIILVKIEELSAGIASKLNKTFVTQFLKNKDFEKVKNEKYIICSLDQFPEVQGALFSLRPNTGEIVTLVGGSDFNKSQFNRALQSKRQPGSSFKPLLFAAGLENGFNPATVIIDSPEALGGAEDDLSWKPRNYDGDFLGPITFRYALEKSRNVPTIKIADAVGMEKIIKFMDRIKFNAKLERDLSVALGSFGVTLKDIVTTYAIFPSGGKLVYPKSISSIVDRDGNQFFLKEDLVDDTLEIKEEIRRSDTDDQALKAMIEKMSQENSAEVKNTETINSYLEKLSGDQVYDPRLAYVMTNLLRGVVLYGTGAGTTRITSSISPYLAGKTGTTNSYVDAWFIGFSSNLVTGVWTGFDDNRTLGFGESGARSALPIWQDYMSAGVPKFGESEFVPPPGIINVVINKKTGKVAKPGEPDSFLESFAEGMEPSDDASTGILHKKDKKPVPQDSNLYEEDEYFENQ